MPRNIHWARTAGAQHARIGELSWYFKCSPAITSYLQRGVHRKGVLIVSCGLVPAAFLLKVLIGILKAFLPLSSGVFGVFPFAFSDPALGFRLRQRNRIAGHKPSQFLACIGGLDASLSSGDIEPQIGLDKIL